MFHVLALALTSCSVAWTASLPAVHSHGDGSTFPTSASYHPTHVLVRFDPSARAVDRQAAHRAAGAAKTLTTYSVVPGLELIELDHGDVIRAVNAYQGAVGVLYAEPDYVVQADVIPNDAFFDRLWGLRNVGQAAPEPGTPGADIRVTDAWSFWTGDSEFKIAIIDTGVDYNHPDLTANIWTNPAETPDNGIDDDGNGYVDDVHGYDFANEDADPMDDNRHGTHTAGTIGAIANNGEGVAGVNWQCKIVALKFLGSSGIGSTSDAILSLQYVVDNNIRVSNNSWGSGTYSQALYDTIEASQAVGHLFVVAAGNSARDADVHPHYPAAYDLPNVISVAATNSSDELASFSNWGAVSVDLGAPGAYIYSTVPDGAYAYLSGTSMATPHVTGIVALMMSRYPALDWQLVKARIMSTVRPVAALDGLTVAGGIPDTLVALGDCNGNGIDDAVDIANQTSEDCTGNGFPDECEPDCNGNGTADSCDIASGSSGDCDGLGIPDECKPDCNQNDIPDRCDILAQTSFDCNENIVPDECEIGGTEDCDGNGEPDLCELYYGTEGDCDKNGVPDTCDVVISGAEDCDGNLVPDACEVAWNVLLSEGSVSEDFIQSIEDIGYQVDLTNPAQFPSDLTPYEAVVFGPKGFPPGFAIVGIIDEYVRRGGLVVLVQGAPGWSVPYYGEASPIRDATGWMKRTYTHIVDAAHPLTEGLPLNSTLEGWSAAYTLKPRTDVVVAWDDGTPMTVFHQYGKGKVVLINDLWSAYFYFWHGDTTYGVALMANILGQMPPPEFDCNGNGVTDACDIAAGISSDCSGDGVPDECDTDCNENGTPDSCDIFVGTAEDADGDGLPDECRPVLFVDQSATGLADGSTWQDAFQDLQSALDAAPFIVLGVDSGVEVWVAAGTYVPSKRTDPDDPRSVTFQLVDGVGIYGGFVGGETRLDQRDIRHNIVTLSGDLVGNDGPDSQNNEENAYSVVTGSDTFVTAVLDGVTISGGNAYEADGYSDTMKEGAGLFAYRGSPTIKNCSFTGNLALNGGALLLSDSDSLIENCRFLGNQAGERGGALFGAGGNPIFVNCVFSGNTGGEDPDYAGTSGGAADCRAGSTCTFTNCVFVHNDTGDRPGAGGVYADFQSSAELTNCILWNNTEIGAMDYSAQVFGTTTIEYSNVLGWNESLGGVGNMNLDPSFADPDGPDDIIGTVDDDVRLLSNSPCIDAGDNDAVPLDDADVDRDFDYTEPLPLDLAGRPRFVDFGPTPDTGNGTAPIVDMGAFESDACGNGIIDPGEDCDDAGESAACDVDCTFVSCGDGVHNATAGEACDDGYNDACGTCNASCTAPGTGWLCGDGVVCPEREVCDDGYNDACGSCNGNCTVAGAGSTCGDGIICPETEACDDFGESATCDTDCSPVECGDGVLNESAGESCDDGFNDECGTCNSSCTGPGTGSTCGDGSVCPETEACDDGGLEEGDGCTSMCTIDVGWACAGAPSVCGTDCNGNHVADFVEIADCPPGVVACADCDANAQPDECDVPPQCPSCQDCDANGVPDVCDPDDNGDGTPDVCQLQAPLQAAAPNDRTKNRYLSFQPNDGVMSVAFQVTLTDSVFHPALVGSSWWVLEPIQPTPGVTPKPLLPSGECFAYLGPADGAAEINWNSAGCQTLHITGCPIEPASAYDITAFSGTEFSGSITLLTTPVPADSPGRWWGDTVGHFNGTEWTAPNGNANIDDAVVAIKAWQGGQVVAPIPGSNVPHLSVADVVPGVTNAIVNFADVLELIHAFQGDMYRFGPADADGNCP